MSRVHTDRDQSVPPGLWVLLTTASGQEKLWLDRKSKAILDKTILPVFRLCSCGGLREQ